jgi:hypothetical protein
LQLLHDWCTRETRALMVSRTWRSCDAGSEARTTRRVRRRRRRRRVRVGRGGVGVWERRAQMPASLHPSSSSSASVGSALSKLSRQRASRNPSNGKLFSFWPPLAVAPSTTAMREHAKHKRASRSVMSNPTRCSALSSAFHSSSESSLAVDADGPPGSPPAATAKRLRNELRRANRSRSSVGAATCVCDAVPLASLRGRTHLSFLRSTSTTIGW